MLKVFLFLFLLAGLYAFALALSGRDKGSCHGNCRSCAGGHNDSNRE